MNMRIDSLDTLVHHQAGMEVGNTELKRQVDQAKRFGNEGYKQHSQLKGVKNAVQSLQPEQLLTVLKSTQQALTGKGGITAFKGQDIPVLSEPAEPETTAAKSSGESKLSSSATMTALLGKISQLTTDSSLANLVSRLDGFNAMMQGTSSMYSSLAGQLEEQAETWADAVDTLKEAQEKNAELSGDVDAAQTALDEAKKALSELEAEAAKHEKQKPVYDELKEKIADAKAVVANAESRLTQATNTFNNHTNNVLKPAVTAESNTRITLQATQAKTEKLIATLSPQQHSAIELHHKQSNENAKSLTFLMALISKLIDKSSSEDLQASAELKQKLAEASAKDAEKKAKEYEEEVRKAEEMQKTMGCIGKVLGWLITAVSFVAAVFTGGASLALAAVGLALAIGDEIHQAVTGESFMAEAMQPLMDAIVKPLMEMMGKMFSAILEQCGVDKETADMVGQILGAVAAAAALVVGVVVAGSVMSKVFGVVMKKIGMDIAEEAGKTAGKNVAMEIEKEVVRDIAKTAVRTAVKDVATDVAQEVAENTSKNTMQRLMDSAVGQVFKRLSQGVGRSAGMDELKMAQVSNRTQIALTGATMANTSIQAAGGIMVADMMVDASKIRAQMMKDAAMQDLLNEMMERVIDTFSQRMETVNEIVRNISVVAENQMKAGKYITRQMAHVAG